MFCDRQRRVPTRPTSAKLLRGTTKKDDKGNEVVDQAEEAEATRSGHLKIMLGYASGVGKTFRFIEEMHAKASGRKRAASAPKALGEVCMETYC